MANYYYDVSKLDVIKVIKIGTLFQVERE